MHEGWLCHSIAETIKVAVVQDWSLFELLEDATRTMMNMLIGVSCEVVSTVAAVEREEIEVNDVVSEFEKVAGSAGSMWSIAAAGAKTDAATLVWERPNSRGVGRSQNTCLPASGERGPRLCQRPGCGHFTLPWAV